MTELIALKSFIAVVLIAIILVLVVLTLLTDRLSTRIVLFVGIAGVVQAVFTIVKDLVQVM